jgi:hypothetical protein
VIHFLNRVSESLTAKLVIALGVLILVGSVVFLCASVQTDKKNLMDNTLAFVSSLSEVTKRSIRHDMLTFHREDIQNTLESIGDSGSIEQVRIFNGRGRIFFSSDRTELGEDVDTSSPACIGCHADPVRPQDTLARKNRWTIYEGPEGHRVLSLVEPIYNEPDCYTSPKNGKSLEFW